MLALLLATQALVQVPAQDAGVAAWTEDIRHLAAEIERLHPAPFAGSSRAEFEAAKSALIDSLGKRSDDEVVVELMRLVALIAKRGRDGHSFVWSTGFGRLPLQLYRFDDGWFVVAAPAPDADLVGARLVALGTTPVEEAAQSALPIVTRDNEWDARSKISLMLVTPEVLRALAVVPPGDELALTFECAGKSFERRLRPGSGGPPAHLLPPVGALPGLKDRERSWWSSVLEPQHALYAQYNEVRAVDGEGGTLAEFAAGLVRTFEERHLECLILDLRSNGGGDNTTFGPLVDALRGNARLNQKGRLFVLTSRETFSAGSNFVTVMDRDTQALLVGEPTGGAPNQYGDAEPVELPNHNEILVRIATRYHAFGGPEDDRLTHEPDLRVPYTSADYFAGLDPVLQSALAYEPK